jgi:hypothetical protein
MSGPAVLGFTNLDWWNYLGTQVPGPIANLLNTDWSYSPVNVAAGGYFNAATDASYNRMLNAYIFGSQNQNLTLTFTGLPGGSYIVCAYSFDGNFSLSAGGTGYGTLTTSYTAPVGLNLNPPPWLFGLDYVCWNNVAVAAGQSLVLTVMPGLHDGYPIICGVQIAQTDGDGSGLPVPWELDYFGTTGVNPNAQPTGDGLNNYEAYLLGINPNQAARPDTNGWVSLQVYTPFK